MNLLLKDLKIFLTLSFISLLFILFDSIGILNFPKRMIQYGTVPIQYGLYQFGKSIKAQTDLVFLARFTVQENQALKLQWAELITENTSLRKRISELEGLIGQQETLSPTTFDMESAHIIGVGRYLTLDKGLDNGIQKNQVVVFKDNFIGKVLNVNPKTSTIILPFDPDSKISVYAQNKSGRAKGILVGQFGSDLLMDKILHEESIEENDLVYSEGLEGDLPKGLILGKVVKILGNENEVFKQAEVRPIFEIADLDVVFVLLK